MAGEDDQNINNQPYNPPLPTQQSPHTVSTIKLLILKKGEYDIWAMKMEHYLAHTDYPVWEGTKEEIKEQPKALLTIDADVIDRSGQAEEEEEDHAFMAYSSSGSDTEVTSCSKECKESYAKIKKLYDEQREQLSDASIEIKAYTQALKKVEAQLVAHQQNQLWYEEKIRFMKIDLDDKTDVLTYHKKLLAEAEKEKEELKAKVEKWHNSSKNLNILLNSQMSARDKAGLGYGNQMNKGVLSYENEVFGSLFNCRSSDTEDSPVNNRYAEGMHAVPPPMTGIYIPSGPDKEIDDSQFTYGPKQSKPSESDARSSDFTSCESNSSEETHESMPETVVNEPTVVSQPKVWTDAPIIEEYESDSEDEHVSLPSKEQETPSFANTIKHIKTPRQTVKKQNICSKSPKPDKKDYSGLISKKLGLDMGLLQNHVELNKQKGKGNVQRENKPIWNNVQRVNHKNQFVPTTVLTRTGKILVKTARASGTNNVSTARHNFNSQAVLTNDARKISTVKPFVNKSVLVLGFRKATTRVVKFLARTYSWQCKKQTIVATSTTEAEYVVAANSFGQVLWIQNQISIHYALTVSYVVSTTFVEQFWMFAKSKTINNVRDKTLRQSAIFDTIKLWGNVTPLFDSMLVQPTKDKGEALKIPSESQPIPSPSHPKGSGGNHGGQSSSDKSLSGNEDGLTL
ncbi:hypothetical protein Tco_1377698 [Tanacetum coccineum]